VGSEASQREGASLNAQLRVTLLGTRFVLDGADPDVGAELRRLLEPFLPAAGIGHDGTPARRIDVAADADAADPVVRVLTELNTTALADVDSFAVHAGAVSAGGQVVAFPGGSGAGKSTLTAACLRADLDYVSDEALCVRWDTGAVLPYPRPIALSAWSAAAVGATGVGVTGVGATGVDITAVDVTGVDVTGVDLAGPAADGGERLFTAADLGATVAAGPLTLAHVVLPSRADGRAGPTLEPVRRGEAVAELLRRSFSHWRRPERAFGLAHELVAAARTWRLTLSDPAEAARLIADLLQP
jgi:hypothetical protein